MENYPGNTTAIQIVDGKRASSKMASVADCITLCFFSHALRSKTFSLLGLMQHTDYLLLSIFVLCAGFALSASAHAATYYVATQGNDSNPGTQDAPWRTIQKAANAANAGDTVNVGPGTYVERVNMRQSGITFIGSGNKESIIDGSTPTSGWTSDGNGVWKTTSIGKPYAMTVEGKTVWRLDDTVMNGSSEYGNANDLRRPADQMFSSHYVDQLPWWEGVEALFGQRGNTTYLRIRNGDNPAHRNVRSAPAGGVVTIDGKSNITLRNFTIVGGQYGVRLTGGSSDNIIEDSYLSNGRVRIFLGRTSNNIIRNNEITMNGICCTQYRPGEWGTSTYARKVMHQIYAINKFPVGTSSEDDKGIEIEAGASNNQIIGNHIHDGVVGISLEESNGTKILGNTIHNFSAQGIFPSDMQGGSVEIGGNLLYDNDHNIRIQNVERNKTVYIYANRFHEPLEGDGGKHVHFSFIGCGGAKDAACSTDITIWIYHNSFAGGGWAVNGGGKNLVMPNVHVINNIFSSRGINESYGAKGVEFSSNLETQMWRSNHLPDFQPPKNARNVGRTLSNLPGMTAAYFGDGRPDIGAVQVGGSAVISTPSPNRGSHADTKP